LHAQKPWLCHSDTRHISSRPTPETLHAYYRFESCCPDYRGIAKR
jgi:hypothetical protein